MRATLSLKGIYDYDPRVLDSLVLPSGVDPDILIPELLLQTMELEILIPEPSTLSYSVGVWSRSRVDVWAKMLATTKYDYDPISNYDRHETETETHDGDITRTNTGGHTNTSTGTRTNEQKGTLETETNVKDYVAGFNDSSTLADTARSANDTTETVTPTGWKTEDKISADDPVETVNTHNDTDTETDNRTITRTVRAYGNIGTTTTQSMILQEREVDDFSIYQFIIDDFMGRFCILVF